MAGYIDQQQTISISADQTANLNFALEILQSGGSIFVQSNPPGATIFIDGVDTGFLTPKMINNLTAGNHNISLQPEWMQ